MHAYAWGMFTFCRSLLSRSARVPLRRLAVMASSSSAAASAKALPNGLYPTMITPFLNNDKKSVDWNGLDIITDWYIRSGVAGIFSVCLSSEMYQLTNEERVAIARRVVDKSGGRVPVVVGATFEGGLEEQAGLMREMGKFADAVVIITNQIAAMEESDEVWMNNCQKLMDLTGDIPLGLYETPIPKVRSLTPPMLKWIAETGRFVFHKDTSLDTQTMLSKMAAVKSVPSTPLKFFTAKTQFIKICLDNGGNGFSGVSANFFPWVISWLCGSTEEAPVDKREKVQEFLSVGDRVIAHKYPTSAKVYLSKFYGVPIRTVSRIHDVVLNEQDILGLKHLKSRMDEFCSEMNIPPVDPMK